MSAGYVELTSDHRMVGVDADGQLCACGVKQKSFLEHAAAAALFMLDSDLLHRCPCGRLRRMGGMCGPCFHQHRALRRREDARWVASQRRVANLATFQAWPAETVLGLAGVAGVNERKESA